MRHPPTRPGPSVARSRRQPAEKPARRDNFARLCCVGDNFLYKDQGAPFRRAPAAARADSSCLRPVVVSTRAELAANGLWIQAEKPCLRRATLEDDPKSKLRFCGGAGQLGSSPRTSPGGLPDADQRPAEQSLPPEGMTRVDPFCGLRPSATRQRLRAHGEEDKARPCPLSRRPMRPTLLESDT